MKFYKMRSIYLISNYVIKIKSLYMYVLWIMEWSIYLLSTTLFEMCFLFFLSFKLKLIPSGEQNKGRLNFGWIIFMVFRFNNNNVIIWWWLWLWLRCGQYKGCCSIGSLVDVHLRDAGARVRVRVGCRTNTKATKTLTCSDGQLLLGTGRDQRRLRDFGVRHFDAFF